MSNLLMNAARDREFVFEDADFAALRKLVREITGIALSEQKRELVYGRLARRLRTLGISSFREYRDLLARDTLEQAHLTNAITTNLTSFFREKHHFDHVRDQVLRPLAGQPERRIRIWSAGCSTGEEPYSIAMTVAEALPDFARRDIRILATDLDSEVLAKAEAGVYGQDRVQGMAPERMSKFFRETTDRGQQAWGVVPALRSMISFKQLNLMHALPMQGPLDIIFCRNVIIYFDKDTQRDLFSRIRVLQRPGDLLCLGHSESLFRVSEDYTSIGRTMYRRN